MLVHLLEGPHHVAHVVGRCRGPHEFGRDQLVLLDPFGLDESKLAAALATIATHRIDDADLYFQYSRSEGWSLEKGIVKSASFNIEQGVGVRAVSGEKTALFGASTSRLNKGA